VEGGDLGVRRARNGDHHHVVIDEMDQRALHLVATERTANTALLPLRPEHEVLDDELAAAGEQVGERLLAIGPVEHIALVNLDPGQLAALARQLVMCPKMRFLLGEQRAARCQPFVAGDGLVRLHDGPLQWTGSGRLRTALNTVPGTVTRLSL
jgi:hypothetical protein